MSRWFRHYAGMARDEKLVRAALRSKQPIERVVWVWAAILESAAEIDDDGRYELDAAEVAYFLRADQADIDAVLNSLEALGRISLGRVAKWGERQFQSDRSSERVRAYRDRKRQSVDGISLGNEPADVSETPVKRFRNSPETDTETERKRPEPSVPRASAEPNAPISDFPSQSFDAFWNAYPNRKGKDAARKSFDRVRRGGEVTFDALMAAIDAYKRFKPPDREWCHPATWLNQGRWNDDWTTESTRRLPQQPPARRSGADALMAALTAELGGSDDRGLEHGRASRTDFSGGPIVDLEPLGPTRSVVGSRQ